MTVAKQGRLVEVVMVVEEFERLKVLDVGSAEDTAQSAKAEKRTEA